MKLQSDRSRRGLAMLLCVALLLGTVAGLPVRTTEAVSGDAETENVASGPAFCTIKATGEQAEVLDSVMEYNGREIAIEKTPLVKYQGQVLVAFSPVLHKKGPKVSYEYTGKTGRVRLVRENKVVTFHMDNRTYHASGQKKSFSVAPLGGCTARARDTSWCRCKKSVARWGYPARIILIQIRIFLLGRL